MSRARGPHSAKHTRPEVMSRSAHAPVVRQVPAEPRQVVLPYAVPVMNRKRSAVRRVTVRSHSIPPRRFEQLRVDDPSRPARSTSLAHIDWRNATAPGPTISSLANEVSSNSAGRPARCQRLRADRRRPVLARPAARSVARAARRRRVGVRLEPVRALPAGLLAEDRAELLEDLVGRRHPQRPAGLALLVRVVDVVVGRVVLDRPRERVRLRPIGRPEPPDVHLPEVELGLAVDDPGRHLAADAARAGDAVGREAGGHEEPSRPRFAEDELVVRA